jgi:hypothetical protein
LLPEDEIERGFTFAFVFDVFDVFEVTCIELVGD